MPLSYLLLWSCAVRQTPETLFHNAEEFLRQGKVAAALSAADQGFRAEPSWRFRLLRSKVLQSITPRQAIEALASPAQPPTPELRARVEMYRGWAEFLLTNYPGAEADFERAREIAAPLRLPLLEAELGLDSGSLEAQQGKTASAEERFRDALRQATDYGDPYLQTRAMGSLGVLFLYSHRPDEAIYWLEKDRDASKRVGWTTSLAVALGNLGSAYYRLGDYDQAIPFLNQAEAIFDRLGDRRQQQIWLGNIGNVLLDQRDYSRAAETYKRAVAIAREVDDPYWTAVWEFNLAIAAIHVGDFDEAERDNNEALHPRQSIQAPGFYPVINQAGIAAGRHNDALAEKLYRGLLAEPSEDPVPMLQAESGLADLLAKTGQTALADAQFRSGIDRVERRRAGLTRDEYKLSYFSSLIDFYQRYVDFLVRNGEAEKAAAVAESGRARLLDERLNAAGTAPLLTTAAFTQLARSSGTVILSYWLAPDRSFLWAVTPAGVTLHVLPGEKQIAALVESYRSFIESLRDPLESEFPAGRKLSEILLGQVRPLLGRGTRIIVVPDRVLNALNFETLPDPEDDRHYLIDRVTVAVAPSLDLLAASKRTRPVGRSLLLIGNPESAVEEYPKLPYAAKEMELIGQSVASDRVLRIEGAQAYPAAYREATPSRFSWIHFAAHASSNRENPLESALILSRRDGGYTLSAREVMKIALDADLVTLSACRSAGAKTYSGEGLVGLSWAFLRAGARSVVAGLWDVTDTSTASLMADFYTGLMNNAAPADALRDAKLRLIGSKGAYRKPFYWGPFQVYLGALPPKSLPSRRDGLRAYD